MAEPTNLPEEDRPGITPDDIPEIRAKETIGERSKGSASNEASADSTVNDGSNLSGSENGGLFRDDSSSNKTQKKSVSPRDLASVELGAGFARGFANASNPASSLKNMFLGSSSRRKKTIAGTLVGLVLGGSIFGFTVLSGPGELLQLSAMLQKNFKNMDNANSSRGNKLMRFATSADIGETRLGILGKQFLRSNLGNLKDIGIEFETNSFGNLKGATIDTEKLSSKYPELNGMTPEEQKAWIAEKYNLSSDKITSLSGSKLSINAEDFPLRSLSSLTDSSLSLLADGKVMTAINTRVLAKYFNIPSLFHPFERSQAAKVKQAVNLADRQAVIQEEDAALAEPVTAEADTAVAKVSSESSSLHGTVMKALLLTGGACFMKSVAGDIVTINRDRVVLPSVIQAARVISVGEQIKAGHDISAEQINALEQSFQDKNGKNLWQGQALQATEGTSSPGGSDLPSDYKQAFNKNTTASNFTKYSNDALGGSTSAAVLCSTPGQIGQIFIVLAASVVSTFGDVASGGTLTPALVALWTAKESLSFAVSAVAMHFVQNFILSSTTTAKLAKDAFSGPLGGNLLAFGAREAANIGARAQGGVDLAGSVAGSLAYQQQQQDQQQFRSESFLKRTFDVGDYRSLTGRLADSMSPKFSTNFVTAINGFGNMGGSLFSSFSAILTPKTIATPQPYDWGFPQVSVPPSSLGDPNLANPYDNGNLAAAILDNNGSGGQDYISKANVCFGDNITKDNGAWNVVKDHEVNPNEQNYIDANCSDMNDPSWRRVSMFVTDTTVMQSMACYKGDDQSCQDAGYGSSSSQAPAAAAPTSGIAINANAATAVAQQASKGSTKVGYALYDSSGKSLGNFGDTTANYGASVTKSMLLVAYLKQVNTGKLSAQATSQLTAMIENSDNCAANWVYSQLKNGASDVNAVASSAGMSNFKLDDTHDTGACSAHYILGQSMITANDFAKFFAKIDTLMPSSQSTFGMGLLSNLSKQDQTGLLQAGIPGTVYSKEGWKPEPAGAEGSPYIVNQAAQFSSGGTTYGVAVTIGGTTDRASGETIIKDLVKALVGA